MKMNNKNANIVQNLIKNFRIVQHATKWMELFPALSALMDLF